MLKLDLDSGYFIFPELHGLIVMIGTKARFVLGSLRKHTFASTGSRFGLECGALYNYPISNRGFYPKNVGYHRFPNVQVCDAMLEQIAGHKLTVYISFTGVEKIRQSNFFYKEEMAVINSAMNLAMYKMKVGAARNTELREVADQMSRFTIFETKVKGEFGKNLKNKNLVIGPKAMQLFAKQFDLALESFQTIDGVKCCMDPKMNGMRYDTNKCELVDENVRKAIERLNRGHHFSANLAGVKNVFKERTDLTLSLNAQFYNAIPDSEDFDVNATIQEFVESKVPVLYEELRTTIFEISPGSDAIYYFDIGVELTSLDRYLDLVTLTDPADKALRKILEKP